MQEPIALNLQESDSDDFPAFQRRAGAPAPRIAKRQIPSAGHLHEDSQSDSELNINLSPELLRINTYHNLTTLANLRSARLIHYNAPRNETIDRSEYGAESGLNSDQDTPQERVLSNRVAPTEEDNGDRRDVEDLEELYTSYNQARLTHAGELFHSFLSEITPPVTRPTPQLEESRPPPPRFDDLRRTLLEEFNAPPPPTQTTALESAYFASFAKTEEPRAETELKTIEETVIRPVNIPSRAAVAATDDSAAPASVPVDEPFPPPSETRKKKKMAHNTTTNAFAPDYFHGTAQEDPQMWLRSVRHWLTYKEMDDAEKARSFPVMLRGSALIWYENVAEDIKDDFEKMAEAFLARYHIVGVTGWKDAASMWCTPQLPHQSVDDYLNQMERKASKTSMPEEQKRYAIINGLKPSIRQQVLQHEITQISQIRHWATIAEASENQGEPQSEIANLAKQVKILTEQLTTTKVNALAEAQENSGAKVRFQENTSRARTPSPRRPQQFQENDDNSWEQYYPATQNLQYPRPRGPFQGGPTRFAQRPAQPRFQNFGRNFAAQSARQSFTPRWSNFQSRPRAAPYQGGCSNCFRSHPQFACPAQNLNCASCGRRGHMARACRSTPQST